MKIARVVAALAIAGVAAAAVPLPVAAQQAPQYGIREDQPRVGTLIRAYAVRPIAVPINQAWGELAPADKARWRQHYEAMADDDEPPFPVEGLKALFDPIRKAQAKLLVRGELFLVATVAGNGSVEQVQAHGSPDPQMTRFAAETLLLTRFKPAVCAGQPCRMDFPLRLQFNVE